MTAGVSGASRRRRGRKRNVLRPVLVALGLLLAFGLGVGFGRALEQNDPARATRTSVRTLKPLPLPPAERTVTVTVTQP